MSLEDGLLEDRTNGSFATELVMSAGVNSPKNCLSRNLLGLHIATFGWNAALAHAEELALSKGAFSKGERATVAFLDEARLIGMLFGLGRHNGLNGQILLPGGSVFLRLLLKRLWRKQPLGTSFSPARFIPALLTYFAAPRRIGFIGNDKIRLDALCAHFGRHTPWHEFVAIAPGASLSGRLDLVVVDMVAEHDIEDRLDGADIGLVVMAGSGLSCFAQTRPVASGAQNSISKPSLA
jgi:hypothetical protein